MSKGVSAQEQCLSIEDRLVQIRVKRKWFLVKMAWFGIGMWAIAHIAVSTFTHNFSIAIDGNPKRCIPEYMVYFLNKRDKHVVKGNIYQFHSRNMTPFFKDGMPIGKYAVALEGDVIVQNEQGVHVNGNLVAAGYPQAAKAGFEPEQLYKRFKLAKGEVFFLGTSEYSYDSRYWGVANLSQVVGKATPLW